MAVTPRAPLPLPPSAYDVSQVAYLREALEQRLQDLEAPAALGYLLTAHTTASRSLNETTATTAQVAAVLATLISDLKARGMLA